MNPTLQKYVSAFMRLNRGTTKYGKAPHKPILLLSLIELIDKGSVQDNRFEVDVDLVATFKENWLLLVQTPHQLDFTQPFYHLQGDKLAGRSFWMLRPNPGMQIDAPIKSIARLSEACAFGHFDAELFLLLIEKDNRMLLTRVLLEAYFSESIAHFTGTKNESVGYIREQEEIILNEPETRYRHEVANEEDVFVRSGLFKKWVPKIYAHQCSFTGMQLSSTFGHSLIDACHIVPFSLTQDDKVTNGIALCPNLHRAFDRGLVSISDDYKILVSGHLIENEQHAYALQGLSGKNILLPSREIYFPDRGAIAWHRKNIFKP